MTKPAGTYATTLGGFAVAREVRSRRQAAGLTPQEAAKRAGVARGKLDALELGYYGSRDPRKRPGRFTLSELRALTGTIDIGGDDAAAIEALAGESGALAAEPRTANRPAGVAARIEALCDQYRSEYGLAPAAAVAKPHERLDWTPPSPRCPRFYGRAALIEALAATLGSASDRPIVLVSGPAGIGKSELVQIALRHPDLPSSFAGLRWLSARRREFLAGAQHRDQPTIRGSDILRDLARGLRCAIDELPRVFAEARWLIVIDNFEAVDDEVDLLGYIARVAGQSRFLVTSRSRLAAPFIRNVPERGTVPGLGLADVRALLTDAIGPVEPALVARALEVTRGAPLLLHWSVGQGHATALDARLDQLAVGDAEDLYQFSFESDWRRATTKAREVLDFLAHQITEPLPAPVLHEAGVAKDESLRALNELAEAGLIESTVDGDAQLVSLHPLTSAFVRRRLATGTRWSGERDAAWRAGLAYLRNSLIHDRQRSAAIRPIGGITNYLDWMTDAVAAGEPVEALTSWLKLSRFLWENWQWQHFGRCEEIADQASVALATRHEHAGAMLAGISRTDRAYQLMERADYDNALDVIADALTRFNALDDDAGRSLCHRYRGLVHLRRARAGDLGLAREAFTAALAAIEQGRGRGFPAPGTPAAEASAELRSLGVWDTLTAGYAAYRSDWAPSEAEVHSLLAGVLLNESRGPEAVDAARQAIARYRDSANRWPGSEAAPMLTLGRALLATGQLAAARATFEEALAVTHATRRLDLQEGALLELARLDAPYDPRRALERATAALAIATSLRQATEIANAEELVDALTRSSRGG